MTSITPRPLSTCVVSVLALFISIHVSSHLTFGGWVGWGREGQGGREEKEGGGGGLRGWYVITTVRKDVVFL